ncbi:hypothetical protein DFS34DRAFT_646755 [Phlyctochytrium arcticum]|nr:hypothetical protein DFS34DRAFT_655137 [Phlyctochytrium arcticum]KAI9103370.1 hypothetical protein DFS34DRAFT_646755 [Phlyctochytrium arcticum]
MPKIATDKSKSITIVGLRQTDNGRRCGEHPNGCGALLAEADEVRFEEGLSCDVRTGETFDCVHVRHGSCLVAFVGSSDMDKSKDWTRVTGVVTSLALKSKDVKRRAGGYCRYGSATVKIEQ